MLFLILEDLLYSLCWVINSFNFFEWLYLCLSLQYLFKVLILLFFIFIYELVKESIKKSISNMSY
jgi:hypothetical protein